MEANEEEEESGRMSIRWIPEAGRKGRPAGDVAGASSRSDSVCKLLGDPLNGQLGI